VDTRRFCPPHVGGASISSAMRMAAVYSELARESDSRSRADDSVNSDSSKFPIYPVVDATSAATVYSSVTLWATSVRRRNELESSKRPDAEYQDGDRPEYVTYPSIPGGVREWWDRAMDGEFIGVVRSADSWLEEAS
jgi:hypothetical protein